VAVVSRPSGVLLDPVSAVERPVLDPALGSGFGVGATARGERFLAELGCDGSTGLLAGGGEHRLNVLG